MPDTEVNNNIFLKINDKYKTNTHDTTSQLDLQELVKQIESDISDNQYSSTSNDQDSIKNLSIININDEHLSDNLSSEDEYENKDSNDYNYENNSQIDAETSED